jgi:hypothetical protein
MKPETPLPWKWAAVDSRWSVVEGADGTTVIDDGGAGGEYSQVIDPVSDNAAYIVHAANLYPELLQACRAALVTLSDDDIYHKCIVAHERLKDAIAKAMGEA